MMSSSGAAFFGGEPMDVMHRRCAGMDVHKKDVHVCVRKVDEQGRAVKEFRVFGTMTRDLLALRDWLREHEVTHAAMESTGVYWKPVYHILEGSVELLLCNARHMRNVPGRKTDMRDSEWIAELLQHGLLRASYVPAQPVRELRDLTRTRASMEEDKTRIINRVHKILEDANIKLSSVASDIMGVTGRQIIYALIGGQTDPALLAELAKGKLQSKKVELTRALEGKVTEHVRFMLRLHMEQLKATEGLIETVDQQIENAMTAADLQNKEESPIPFLKALNLLVEMWGISRRSAENILAEVGTNMGQFPSADHFASWAGLCPGNNKTAGKNKSGATRKGSRWLKRALTQAAWAASRAKKSYMRSRFHRLSQRRGKQRALIAVAHTMLRAIYHMLKHGVAYVDLGPNHYDQVQQERLRRYLVKRLEKLGYAVHLSQAAAS
jgi:transposase